jgi:hypothetical protein
LASSTRWSMASSSIASEMYNSSPSSSRQCFRWYSSSAAVGPSSARSSQSCGRICTDPLEWWCFFWFLSFACWISTYLFWFQSDLVQRSVEWCYFFSHQNGSAVNCICIFMLFIYLYRSHRRLSNHVF